MTTYYVDKRVATNGNGSVGSPYKAIKEVCSPSIGANAVIEIVAGSGPYIYGVDFGYLSQPNIYLNHTSLSTVTWNFNGNILTSEKQLINNPLYEWHPSVLPGLYYCTALAGANPSFPIVKSGIVNETWDADSTSLFALYENATPAHTQKWGRGDYDSLGFETVYVRGINPNDITNSVLISVTSTRLITADSVASPANEIFNDLISRGGGNDNGFFSSTASFTFNRCQFHNTDGYAIRSLGPSTYNYCLFKNNGHEAFSGSGGSLSNQTAINCYFENTHVITKLLSGSLTNTVTIKNCKTKNMLAGGIQFDTPSTQTFVESNNQWHVDMVNNHGGQAIAFSTGTRKWTTTAASDFPASTATSSNSAFVLPEAVPEGSGLTIAGLHDQATAVKDINKKNVLFLPPNIGCVDGRTSKIISSTDFAPTGYEVRSPGKLIITGGGDINLSGLTDTGVIDVFATQASVIKAFTGNGTGTAIKGVGNTRLTGHSKHFR